MWFRHLEGRTALPINERWRVERWTEQRRARRGELLQRRGAPVDEIFILEEGLVSVGVGLDADAPRPESKAIGVLGGGHILGVDAIREDAIASHDVAVETTSTVHALSVPALRSVLPDCHMLRRQLDREQQLLFVVAHQSALCAARHTALERYTRWLLMLSDACAGGNIPMTQDQLALRMGLRRVTIVKLAGDLRANGLIDYGRSRLRVIDPAALERLSCSCNVAVQRAVRPWRERVEVLSLEHARARRFTPA